MTQHEQDLEALRDRYADDLDAATSQSERDALTETYWDEETALWNAYTGHPHKRPRPRPH